MIVTVEVRDTSTSEWKTIFTADGRSVNRKRRDVEDANAVAGWKKYRVVVQ